MQENNDTIIRRDDSWDEYCPFVKKPCIDCYCVDLNGSKIDLAMRFCLKDFESCRIYRRLYIASVH